MPGSRPVIVYGISSKMPTLCVRGNKVAGIARLELWESDWICVDRRRRTREEKLYSGSYERIVPVLRYFSEIRGLRPGKGGI
jgi:hypothetical protein